MRVLQDKNWFCVQFEHTFRVGVSFSKIIEQYLTPPPSPFCQSLGGGGSFGFFQKQATNKHALFTPWREG